MKQCLNLRDDFARRLVSGSADKSVRVTENGDTLQAHQWWTVVEWDTGAMCPRAHSMDKGSRVP